MNMFTKLMKKQKQTADALDKARDDKCIPLAQKTIALIADAKLSMTDKDHKEYLKEYEPIVLKVLRMYLDADLKMTDVSYIKSLLIEMIEKVDSLVVHSVNDSLRIGEKAAWGANKDEMTFRKLDEILKKWGKEQTIANRIKNEKLDNDSKD